MSLKEEEGSDTPRLNIAIDGYSACGKSTLAKQLAQELNLTYIDTGAMYRAITLLLIRNGKIDDLSHNVTIKELGLELVDINFETDPVSYTHL